MIISYRIDYRTPKYLLGETEIELLYYGCIYQIRYFRSSIMYIISDYFDHNREHHAIFVEIIMKHLFDYILPSNLNQPTVYVSDSDSQSELQPSTR